MKILFTIFLLFFSSSVFAIEEVFYCSDIESGGLHYKENNYKLSKFIAKRFKVKIDFERLTIDSSDLSMERATLSETICQTNYGNDFMSCSNPYGYIFTININKLNYTRAITYGNIEEINDGDGSDSLAVYYGTCQKF